MFLMIIMVVMVMMMMISTLAGGLPPSAWQTSVTFVFSKTWKYFICETNILQYMWNTWDMWQKKKQMSRKWWEIYKKSIITSIFPLSPGLRLKLDGGVLGENIVRLLFIIVITMSMITMSVPLSFTCLSYKYVTIWVLLPQCNWYFSIGLFAFIHFSFLENWTKTESQHH